MQLVREHNVNIVIDLHEAELLYPVTNCIVAPSKSATIAVMTQINLSGDFDIHTEPSPVGYRGLSHREIGDHSDAYPFLLKRRSPSLTSQQAPRPRPCSWRAWTSSCWLPENVDCSSWTMMRPANPLN